MELFDLVMNVDMYTCCNNATLRESLDSFHRYGTNGKFALWNKFKEALQLTNSFFGNSVTCHTPINHGMIVSEFGMLEGWGPF